MGVLNLRPKVTAVAGTGQGAVISPKSITLAPAPTGTGPFTYQVVGISPHVTVLATGTGFTVTPDPGYSGVTVFQFVAIDAAGVDSTPQTATVTITADATLLAFTGSGGFEPLFALGALSLLGGAALLTLVGIRQRRTS